MITIGIPVYDQVDLLDVAGPYEMFNWLNTDTLKLVDVRIISQTGAPVTTRDGLTFEAQACFESAPPLDVLWVPGGATAALTQLMTGCDQSYIDYLKRVAGIGTWVCSVCEGALLLAQAGLLDGYLATTHWAFLPCLRQFPAIKVAAGNPRFIVDRNRVTGGGISSGLDEALKVIELISDTATAQGVQLSTQYFPSPPVGGAIPEATDCPFTW